MLGLAGAVLALISPVFGLGYPPVFKTKSAYVNLSAILSAGGCGPEKLSSTSNHYQGPEADVQKAGSVACKLKCSAHEDVLHNGFEHWWDHKIPSATLQEKSKLDEGFALKFVAAVSEGKVFLKCQSEICEASERPLASGGWTSELEMLTLALQELVTETGFGNAYLFFGTGDQPWQQKLKHVPFPAMQWTLSSAFDGVPLPNPFQLSQHVNGHLGGSQVVEKRQIPWANKIPKVFFRGQISAPDWGLGDIMTIPRIRLHEISKQYPDLFDVAMTGMDSEELKKIFGKAELRKIEATIDEESFTSSEKSAPNYKYVLNVAAVLSAWRLSELLGSGSVLLLQDDVLTDSSEQIHRLLTPWKHYVPIRPGLSDLVEKVRWLEAHQEEAEAMANRLYNLFKTSVRKEDTYCYLWHALRAASQVFNANEVDKPAELLKKGFEGVKVREILETFGKRYTSLSAMLKKADFKVS